MTTGANGSGACPEPGQIAFVSRRHRLAVSVTASQAASAASFPKLLCITGRLEPSRDEPFSVDDDLEVV